MLPSIPLPFPTPPLSDPLFTVMLTVAGVGGFFGGAAAFIRFADPEEYELRIMFEYFAEYAMAAGMFAIDYAVGDLSGIVWWGGMLAVSGIQLRYGFSDRALIALVIATIRRIILEIRKRLSTAIRQRLS